MLYFSFDTPVLYLNCSKKPPLYFPMQNVTFPHRNICNTLLMIDLQMRLYTQAF